ncbi:MAG: FAD-dependent oxidoreductase [Candidatus Cloacimonetes bacterium]|nr:FAD-dependent oxidoreductase [Candidatus Cloacimonadota bacterium]
MIKIKLNGKEVEAKAGNTILEVAQENGVEIPTLCHDEELKPFGSCWVCAVKVKDRKGFVTACGTEALDGMEVITDSEEVIKARKMALELLLSDHYADCEAPCRVACPNNVDVQSYVSLIANGQYHEAVKVIKETLPMPLSIGRVCPAFCEAECRRTIVEEPIAIRQLKRYAADFDLNDNWSFIPDKAPAKNKKIAIIGAGPSGLTCGYYLSNNGYEVTVFESAPQAGGWLRYGIPEYRLPKKILDKEIKLMCANGMKIKLNQEVGKDISLSYLSKKYDAVYFAIGAQNAVPMRVKGSDIEGCYLGVDFLKDFILEKNPKITRKVAVVGGGNTAIDCARTAQRMGAEVTLIYRRTRKEMPAEAYEVDAAEEEGIKFYFLTNPVENFGKNNKLKTIKLEKMKLGEPDESGRRRPEPTGKFFREDFGTVIAAISQSPEVAFLSEKENMIDGKELPLTRWQTAVADEETQYTGIRNIFAGGDFRRGPATAIEAIADGRKAAESIEKFLKGSLLTDPVKLFDSKKEKLLKDIDPKEYEQYEKIARYKMPELNAKSRSSNFEEVETGFTDEDAVSEANRCIECGCQVNETCVLRKYSTEYKIDVDIFMGEKNKHPIDHSHPFILRDANKCIKCGRCVRICAEVQGPGVLGYIYRGFTSYVAPEFGESLTNTSCESCGKCIEVCPVGALVPKNINYKLNPRSVEKIEQNCGLCGTGCKIEVNVHSGKITVINPPEKQDFNKRNLCFDGKFGWQIFEQKDRITKPFIRDDEEWIESTDRSKIIKQIKEKLAAAQSRKIYISPTSTIEEILLMKQVASNIDAEIKTFSYENSFVDEIAKTNLMKATYKDIDDAEVIVIAGKISHTLKTLVRAQQRKGTKLVLITNENSEYNKFADELFNDESVEDTLDRILENYNEEERSQGITPISLEFLPKTLFIYSENHISEEAIWNIWTLAGLVCNFKEGSGVLPTSQYCNFIGLKRSKIEPGEPGNSDFVIFYGELPCEEQRKRTKNSKFILSLNTHTDEADPSHILLPKPSYLEIEGSAIANDGRISKFRNPKKSKLFDDVLSYFKDSGLIRKEHANPEYWQDQAKKFLEQKEKVKNLTDQHLLELLYAIEDVHYKTPKQASVQKKQIAKLKKMTSS